MERNETSLVQIPTGAYATCETCKFIGTQWLIHAKVIACRRYPPNKTSTFPVVEKDDWCGEYSPAFSIERDLAG